MFRVQRISGLHILAGISLLGCTALVLALISTDADITHWLTNNWKTLSLVFVIFYLVNSIYRYVLYSRISLGKSSDQMVGQDRLIGAGDVSPPSELVFGSMEWSRAEALSAAASLPIPDAVYRIVAFNDRCATPLKIEPGELAWLASGSQFEEWSRRVVKLRHAAYHVGDAGLRKDGTYEAARDSFIAANPGFSQDTYESAIGYGYRMAR